MGRGRRLWPGGWTVLTLEGGSGILISSQLPVARGDE